MILAIQGEPRIGPILLKRLGSQYHKQVGKDLSGKNKKPYIQLQDLMSVHFKMNSSDLDIVQLKDWKEVAWFYGYRVGLKFTSSVHNLRRNCCADVMSRNFKYKKKTRNPHYLNICLNLSQRNPHF